MAAQTEKTGRDAIPTIGTGNDSAETLAMLRGTLDRFLLQKYDWNARAAIAASANGWSQSIWQELAELGLLAAPYFEADGGLRVHGEELMVLMEGFGRALVLEPYISTCVIGARLFREVGERSNLQKIASGEMRLALAHDESPFGHGSPDIVTSAEVEPGGYCLKGSKILVRDAPSATHLLISARAADEPTKHLLFLVEAASDGLLMDRYSSIDGCPTADLAIEQLHVPRSSLLATGSKALTLIHNLLDEATVAVCAEAIGVMRAMLEQTVSYTKAREQFGKPLSHFQVLQHRLVDMLIEVEVAESLALRAALAREDTMAVSAAKIRVNGALRMVAQGAVQLHGGIGTTQELALGSYFRRAMTIERLYGTTAHHFRRVERELARELQAGENAVTDVKLNLGGKATISDARDDAFENEVRKFLSSALTPELRTEADRQVGVFASPDLATKWHRILYEKGWIAPSWPIAQGGTDWTSTQRLIFENECARANAPMLPAMGLQMCGPILIAHGTPAQKEFFLPRILSGEHFWCQGYSEPGAGSDLARLKTRAVRVGDHYVVEGTKIWTTYAHAANWMFMLVRTDSTAKPQAGISFLLVPLDAPGITIRPIRSISGEHELNQVFLEEVRVPVSNLVGPENQGWSVAKYLLEFERGGGSATARTLRIAGLLRRFAQLQGGFEPELLHRLARLEIETAGTDWTQRRMLVGVTTGGSVGNANASILKLKASELYQDASTLFLDALGAWGLAEQRDALYGLGKVRGPRHAITGAARYMNSRAMSIFGGSSEIQRGIIAKWVLGL